MPVVSKYVVVVVSGGRTGTQFLGDVLSDMIPNSFSIHEPDILTGIADDVWGKIRVFGLYQMVVGRFFGRTGIRNLNQRFLGGKISLDRLVEEVHRHRAGYYDSIEQDLIIESYAAWFGMLPAIPRSFEHYKIVGIVRDPRTWMTSWMNHAARYGPSDRVTKLGFQRLNPELLGDTTFTQRWPEMGLFEKNCWLWKTVNSMITGHVETDEGAHLFRFEDLFTGQDRAKHFTAMLDFITRFSEYRFEYEFDESALDLKKNFSDKNSFPTWRDWSPAQAKTLAEICNPLMNRLGYGREDEWQELICGS